MLNAAAEAKIKSDVLLWTPTHGHTSITCISSVHTLDARSDGW